MKTKFNLDEAIEIPRMKMVVRAIFLKLINIIHKFS